MFLNDILSRKSRRLHGLNFQYILFKCTRNVFLWQKHVDKRLLNCSFKRACKKPGWLRPQLHPICHSVYTVTKQMSMENHKQNIILAQRALGIILWLCSPYCLYGLVYPLSYRRGTKTLMGLIYASQCCSPICPSHFCVVWRLQF